MKVKMATTMYPPDIEILGGLTPPVHTNKPFCGDTLVSYVTNIFELLCLKHRNLFAAITVTTPTRNNNNGCLRELTGFDLSDRDPSFESFISSPKVPTNNSILSLQNSQLFNCSSKIFLCNASWLLREHIGKKAPDNKLTAANNAVLWRRVSDS
jgi:hypothetical protein